MEIASLYDVDYSLEKPRKILIIEAVYDNISSSIVFAILALSVLVCLLSLQVAGRCYFSLLYSFFF